MCYGLRIYDSLLDILATSGQCGLFSKSIIVRSDMRRLFTLDLALLEDAVKEKNKKHIMFMGGVGKELVKVSRGQFHAVFAHGSVVPILRSAFSRKCWIHKALSFGNSLICLFTRCRLRDPESG